ncbi:HalOD1 output domain-containing protein [Halostella litorea]|uniref:HalOD1 output domain-containing protein n=1 Tax=Halostella litorea TaxID=2528831 RepID=UPI001386D5E9|nr:HalOD1 output domain-containing protein [Halostella litorea]
MSDRGRAAVDVARALARVEGVAPHELGYSLQEYVDADSIDRLAAMEDADWTLTFAVPDHEVTVHSDGRVLVDGERREPEETGTLER